MTQTENPWVRSPQPKHHVSKQDNPVVDGGHHEPRRGRRRRGKGQSTTAPPPAQAPVLTGPEGPQQPMPRVDALPCRRAESTATVWLVGAHGGAGETTLTDAAGDAGWTSGDHAWPVREPGEPCRVILTARTSVRGLMAAQAALTQWAGGSAGPDVQLLGLVLIADAPGPMPRPIRDLIRHIKGGAPRLWELPWSEAVRFDRPGAALKHRAFNRLVSDVRSLASETEVSDESL